MKALLSFSLLLAFTPVHAQTYKWVDEKGVTNYSNTAPQARTARAKVVEERISVVPADPSLGAAETALRMREARRAQATQADWLMRQQLATVYSPPPPPANAYGCTYGADCGHGYGAPPFYPSYPVLVITRSPRNVAPAFPRHHRHVSAFR